MTLQEDSSTDVIVLGAGIIGLTTARLLQQKGYRVHIITRDLPMNTTSAVSAALWFPYRAEPRHAVIRWSNYARRVFEEEMRTIPTCGIMMTQFIELFETKESDIWWGDIVDFVRPLTSQELAEFPKALSGFTTDVPVIQMNVYLPFLWHSFQAQGGTWETREVLTLDDILLLMPQQTILVNCTGLGAKHLLNDTNMFGIRGDILIARNIGLQRSVIQDSHPNYPRYTIAREQDIIIGGTAFECSSSATKAEEEFFAQPKQEYYEGILTALPDFEPKLFAPEVYIYRTGLRPGRTSIRLGKEMIHNKTVIHNYGHGGSGVTLSWGCAQDVADLVIKSYQ